MKHTVPYKHIDMKYKGKSDKITFYAVRHILFSYIKLELIDINLQKWYYIKKIDCLSTGVPFWMPNSRVAIDNPP